MTVTDFVIRERGLEIQARCYLPGEGVYPLIILGHEFALSMKSTGRYAKVLCPEGYAVLVFDFTGSGTGKSKGRSSTEMSVLTQKEDFALVYAHGKTLPHVDPNRIILGGCSQGGLAAAILAAELGSEIEKLILLYPGFSIPDDARRGSKLLKKEVFTSIPFLKLGRKYLLDAMSLEPWREVCSYPGPVFICHGTSDTVVSIKYSREAKKRYPNCRLVELRGAHHAFLLPRTVRKAASHIIAFLKEA